ncbi:SDR family oxidoreductase [Kitasatospora sp. NPDC059327]|uniref:SDR family oxidoreductase n=1 Tax=Kitasatospora sp. NPDC059327 TaxID=3346803 RepID=UPI003689D1A6
MNSTTPTPESDPQLQPHPQPQPRTLVLGATGFLGRWLVLELLDRGEPVAVGVRGGHGTVRDEQLRRWLREHGADDTVLTTVTADLTRPDLGLTATDEARLADVRDIHNLAALYRFGLDRAEAHAVNVDGALHVLHWAAARPRLRRLVHLSGYRVGRDPAPRHPLPAAETDALYRRLGAYEASKQVGDAAVRVTAARLGVPLTTVNPSSVIGHSVTGEAGQYLGPADLVRQLARRRMPLLPGTARTFLPVVAVDHLARFLAAVPEFDDGPAHSHTVLDPATPPLPELVALLADHLGVPAPRALVPVGLVRRLPRALTGADPETLGFLSEDSYDTASADRLARSAGLRHPPVAETLRRWATCLVADGFGEGGADEGAASRPGRPGRLGRFSRTGRATDRRR